MCKYKSLYKFNLFFYICAQQNDTFVQKSWTPASKICLGACAVALAVVFRHVRNTAVKSDFSSPETHSGLICSPHSWLKIISCEKYRSYLVSKGKTSIKIFQWGWNWLCWLPLHLWDRKKASIVVTVDTIRITLDHVHGYLFVLHGFSLYLVVNKSYPCSFSFPKIFPYNWTHGTMFELVEHQPLSRYLGLESQSVMNLRACLYCPAVVGLLLAQRYVWW